MDIRTAARGRFTSIVLSFAAATLLAAPSFGQIAAGKSKFLGNISQNSIPSNFGTYWNQVTPENATKWGSVEGTRNSMNWCDFWKMARSTPIAKLWPPCSARSGLRRW